MLGPESQTEITRELAAPITEAPRINRRSVVELGVEHGTGHLRIVRPRAAIQVVGTDTRPDVVDDTDLGMDVDGCAELVLEVVDADALPPAARTVSNARA